MKFNHVYSTKFAFPPVEQTYGLVKKADSYPTQSCHSCASGHVLPRRLILYMKSPELGKIIDISFPPPACIADSSAVNVRQQDDSTLVNSKLISLFSAIQVCGSF